METRDIRANSFIRADQSLNLDDNADQLRGMRVLLAEHDPRLREKWMALLKSWGFEVDIVINNEQAIISLENDAPDVFLVDLQRPIIDAIEILASIRTKNVDVVAIVTSEQCSTEDIVNAVKLGAFDFLPKPIEAAHLKFTLRRASQARKKGRATHAAGGRSRYVRRHGGLVARSPAMHPVAELIKRVAPSSASVIVVGETGTGKEVVAKTIHELSPRREGPFVAVNCAALPDTLVESAMFGHEKGAFTGANRRHQGYFEIATGGTLLLDEITEMKIELQAKLLRVLEERAVRPVGAIRSISTDCRVLATSNRDLSKAITDGKFRQDLFYRLNVFSVSLPPLRERIEDIPELTAAMIDEFASQERKEINGAEESCLRSLIEYPWPGNIRELRNVIRRAVVAATGSRLTVDDLSTYIVRNEPVNQALKSAPGRSLREIEKALLMDTLKSVNGNKVKAAKILGISLKTMYNRLGRYRRENGS